MTRGVVNFQSWTTVLLSFDVLLFKLWPDVTPPEFELPLVVDEVVWLASGEPWIGNPNPAQEASYSV